MGGGRGSVFAPMDTEKRRRRVPLEPWRAHVGLVRQEQTRRRAREGGDKGTHLPHCVVVRGVGSIVATDNPLKMTVDPGL